LVPLALLPLPIAAYVWFILNAVSILLALLAATRVSVESGSRSMQWAPALLGMAILARFILDNFEWGQINPLVVMLATCHVFLFVRQKKLAAALVLALAVSLKLTPAILLLYHLARKRVRFTLLCGVFIIGITSLSFAPFGNRAVESFHRFVERTIQNQHGFDLSYSGNQSLRGFLSRLCNEPLEAARLTWTPTSLLGSAFLVLLCVAAARRTTDEASAASLFFCLWLIVSPLTWKAHYVGLLLPAVYLVRRALEPEAGMKAASWFVIGLVLVTFNLTSLRIIGQDGAYWVEQHSLILAGCVLVLVCVLMQMLARPRRFC
jgi:alpha-1,2-mannosyltransferase